MRFGFFVAVLLSVTTAWAEDYQFYKERYEKSRSIEPSEVHGVWKGKCNFGKGDRQAILIGIGPLTNEETKEEYMKAVLDIESSITGAPNADAPIQDREVNLAAFKLVLFEKAVVLRDPDSNESYIKMHEDDSRYYIRILEELGEKEYNVMLPVSNGSVYCRLYNNKFAEKEGASSGHE